MRLLTLSNDEIIKLLEDHEKRSEAIKKEIITICWFMRGSISFTEGMELTLSERSIINELIKDNLEITKKSGLPYF